MATMENILTIPRPSSALLPASDLSLAGLSLGVQARVLAIKGHGAIARRLMEMGIVPGAPVRVIKRAPLGDPIEIRVRGYHLALRRTEAQTILVNRES
jgi:ferrous iron transport protein A